MKLIVVGSGIAGMTAAIQAADMGVEVCLISPYSSERSQSVMAAGGINAALDTLGEDDSIESHVEDTYKGGCFLEKKETLQSFCGRAPEHLHFLESLGVIFSRDKKGNIALRAFGGQSHRRTAYAGSSTGKQIVTGLVQKCREYEKKGMIERITGLFFHSALISDGKCYGVVMMNQSGEITPFFANGVILATGGQNKLFGKTTGTEICDGYATGKLFSQGVRLRNLEFIQYHPTTIETCHKKMLITEAARGEGGRLYYLKEGRPFYFMEELFGEKGNLMPRDVVAKCIYDAPSQVFLDISFLGEKLIHERLQEVYDLCKEYINLDVTKESIPVSPSVHFFMGGIAVNTEHETNIKRLYAVGECASLYHGANRLGGNSLLAAVHSGRVAAESFYKKYMDDSPEYQENPFKKQINDIKEEIKARKASKSKYPAVYILKDIAQIMNGNLGITRCEEGLSQGLEQVEFYLKTLSKLKLDPDVSLYENYRLYYMALLAKAILVSARERKESRGAHIRMDYPERSEEFQKSSYATYEKGKVSVAFSEE